MKDISNEDLDNLFKHAAENFQPEFNNQAWEKMDNKLDELAVTNFINTRLWLLAVIDSGVISLILYVIFILSSTKSPNLPVSVQNESGYVKRLNLKNQDTIVDSKKERIAMLKTGGKEDSQKESDSELKNKKQLNSETHSGLTTKKQTSKNLDSEKKEDSKDLKKDNLKNNKDQTVNRLSPSKNEFVFKQKEEKRNKKTDSNENKNTNDSNPQKVIEKENQLLGTLNPAKKEFKNKEEKAGLNERKNSVQFKKGEKENSKKQLLNTLNVTNNESSFKMKENSRTKNNINKNTESKVKETEVTAGINSIEKIKGKPATLLKSKFDSLLTAKKQINASLLKDTAVEKIAVKRPESILKRLGFMVTYSPDFSSVGFKNFETPGSNIGFLIEYNLNKRWTIFSGFIYSKKIYGAKKSDYHTNWNWYPNADITKIDASCTVIDIPLNTRYNFLMRPKFNLYATSGLSSYLMKKENYTYEYPVASPRNIDIYNQNNHFFGVGNFSVGYERILNNRFSIQAEPFVKIPFAGVGAGKIKLNSSGVFISLRYRFR